MKKSSMIGTDLMDEETFAFGFDTGSYQSLFDEGVPSLDFDGKHLSTGINWKNSADLDSPEDGLLELGFPKDDNASKWSLLDQLNFVCEEESILDEAPSPNSSVSNAGAFFDDTCILSPLSDSTDSGVSSCHSPYGTCNLEEIESSVWYKDQAISCKDASNFNIAASHYGSEHISNDIPEMGLEPCEVQESSTASSLFSESFQLQEDQSRDMGDKASTVQSILPLKTENQLLVECMKQEAVETSEVPFIEQQELPPVLVEEVPVTKPNVPIHIMPSTGPGIGSFQKLFLIKTNDSVNNRLKRKAASVAVHALQAADKSVRSSPYPKKAPAKRKTLEQKEKKRDQNRSAATKYRSKKKDELNDLFEEADKLESNNRTLADKVSSLTKEIDYLKSLMLDVIKAKLSRSAVSS